MIRMLLAAYALARLAGYALEALNLCHLARHGREVPPELAGEIDPGQLARTSAYTVDRARLGLAESAVDDLLLVGFVFFGPLAAYDAWLAASFGPLGAGVLFALGLFWAKTVAGLPVDLYATFRLEARYGFNTTTPGLWASDLVKSLVIGSLLLALLAACALGLVAWSPLRWWLWVWLFWIFFQLALLFASPYLIEPLFFKFEPVGDEALDAEIRSLMAGANLGVSRVFQVDASRRSRHSNAYFTGIGRVKRIVLFDTLLGQMNHSEILAVLAHEVGHWKLGHVARRLVVGAAVSLGSLYLAFRLLEAGAIRRFAGFETLTLPGEAVVLAVGASVAAFAVGPFLRWSSRRDERAADRFACTLSGQPLALASALAKLARENLSNLHPHPWYAAFYASHPPVTQRIRMLRAAGSVPR